MLVAALSITAAAPARAFELFGIKFFERDQEEEADVIGEPQPYSVEFVVTGDEVESELKAASNLWADRDEPASGEAGLIAKARDDYRRLLAALYEQGRYGGSISITIDGRQAADLPPDTVLPDPAAVTILVNPGPLFLFDEARIENRAPPATNRRDEVDQPEDEGFRAGEPANSGVILKAERLAVEAWRQQGHAKAAVAERRVVAAHDSDTVDALLRVEPGRRAVYGPTSVEGTERMDPGFVAYMANLTTGEEFDPDDVERARARLARLDVFRSLRIVEGDEIGEDGLLPMSVIVQERALRRIGIGGTYSTVDGLGLETYWLHRNLFGRAERLRLEAKVGGINGVDPNEFTYRVGGTFTRPGIFTPDTNFVTSVFGDREVLEPYTRTGVTVQAGFTHLFTEELSARLFATGRYAKFDDDVYGEREFTSVGVLGGLVYDSRDNEADATEGYYAEVTAEPFYEFNYGNAAAVFTAEGRAYYGFGDENRFVAAGRIKVGSLVGSPISETAPDRLFFAGGGGSVRGYAYRNIGVEVPGGQIVGGRSLIEGSAELRARVTESIGVVGFVDAGYVGAESFPEFDEDVRVGVGAGVRYLTGLGPIRLDVAVPLDPRAGDPDVAFYVGIGQAF
ncbi:autotransporter assembly complex protein TamA [Aquibium oceanicum]|uniref:autotransporter assembly complex protein TamA n=1 Tax=Aquibium oceanicum TaxID=1670800 RepID=UPI000A4A692C|nr:autotransporter assembly complex family protein [Aquibium oceanicum]